MNTLTHHPIKLVLAENISKAYEDLNFSIPLDDIYHTLRQPPDADKGHFAFPCFSLTKQLKKSPEQIALQLKALINTRPYYKRVQVVGPYLNFELSVNFLGKMVVEEILGGNFFKTPLISHPPKTMIEYSQPNTHKELHVGHMRNLCLGDALVKIHRYCGFDIISATFPGDVGTHVAKCLWYLKYHNTDAIPETNKGAWLGRLYSKGHVKLLREEGTPKEIENKKQLSEILTQIEDHNGPFFELWKDTREWSIELMNTVYHWAEVSFDHWYWESEVNAPSVEYVKNQLGNGIFVESEGTIGVDLIEYDLGFCVLIKSDKNGLYATKDLELARQKFEDYHIEKNIYVVDKRQAHHFGQVFKVLELLGFENAHKCYHLAYDFVELPNGPMSSRTGNIIPIMELIHQMHDKIKQDYLSLYIGEWESDEIELTADIIAKGAIKYSMTKMDPKTKIVFDMHEWLNINGNSGTYLQYTHARINAMIKKQSSEIQASPEWSTLKEDIEKKLIVKLSGFNEQVLQACLNYKPNLLCQYLYELAKLYNTFYSMHSIKNTENEVLKSTRLMLSKGVSIILKKGLGLLGIPIPERM